VPRQQRTAPIGGRLPGVRRDGGPVWVPLIRRALCVAGIMAVLVGLTHRPIKTTARPNRGALRSTPRSATSAPSGDGAIPTAAARATPHTPHTRRWIMVCEGRRENQPGAQFYSPKGSAADPEIGQDLNNPRATSAEKKGMTGGSRGQRHSFVSWTRARRDRG
jgi:hypothetical protein